MLRGSNDANNRLLRQMSEETKEEETKGFIPKTEEQIKEEVIEDLKGDDEEFDEEDNADKIERIVLRRTNDEKFKASSHEKATKRKETITELENKLKESNNTPAAIKTSVDEKSIKETLKELKDEEYLEELEHSDELKLKIKTLAKLNGISVKKATEDGYIQSLIKTEGEDRASDNASLSNNNKARAKRNLKDMKPGDFDMMTQQGRDDFEEHKKQMGIEDTDMNQFGGRNG